MTDAFASPRFGAHMAASLLVFALAGCDPLSLGSLFGDEGEGMSVLSLLGTNGREIEVGDEVQGALSAADYVGLNDAFLEAWAFDGEEGQTVTFDVISDDFDSYLYVAGPGLGEVLKDDDGGGACHARVRLTVLESGTFHVVASSNSSRQTGTYRLRASENPEPGPQMSCGGLDGNALLALRTEGELSLGEVASGFLSASSSSIQDDRPVQKWTFQGSAGNRVTIGVQSDDYDSYLYFFGPGMSEVRTDDDGGSGLNSEMTVTLTADGTFTIGAAALSSGSTGSYTVSITEPVDAGNLPTAGRELRVGATEYGFLGEEIDVRYDGQLVQAWAFQARAGERVTFDLISEDFDSYLRVAGPGMSELTNDDGGEDLHSRLTVTFPQDGLYRVIAGSLGGNEGSFTLQAR
jgi:hypothetical protein